MRIVAGLLVLSSAVVSACAPSYTVFPAKAMEGVDRNFDFSRWHMMADESESTKVQLGGRIVQSEVSGDTVTIVVAQLPIVDKPIYGPKDNRKNNGDFVVIYQGQIETADLQRGNRVMVVGTTQPSKVITLDDLSRSFPIVAAQCLHFWVTQGKDIADFPYVGAGYVPLKQETVCAKNL